MPTYYVGDLLTGRIYGTVPVVTGSWSDELNSAGAVGCSVTLRDPLVRGLNLRGAAAVGKSFLAIAEGEQILQAGPIWVHNYDQPSQTLTITAAGMWSYFDHRMLLPVLAGRLPSDPSTDTNFPSSSLHDIARAVVAQAQTWTGGNVPVVVPFTAAGAETRNYKGIDLGTVGGRLKELTQVDGGPDIRFAPQFTADKRGIRWQMLVGTPTTPLLSATNDVLFTVSAVSSTVSNLAVSQDGTSLASQVFATGGSTSDTALVAVTTDPTLTDLGYPFLESVDSSHQTVADGQQLQSYTHEAALAARQPVELWTFDHDPTQGRPYLGSFNVGDFARVTIHDDSYVPDGAYRMRITKLSGDQTGKAISITSQPEIV